VGEEDRPARGNHRGKNRVSHHREQAAGDKLCLFGGVYPDPPGPTHFLLRKCGHNEPGHRKQQPSTR
jgi:hypothetical protein